MRAVSSLGLFIFGLLAALSSVSFIRSVGGSWGFVQIPLIVLVLAVFFLKENRLAALTVGMGIGLDILSAYPFFIWSVILIATVIVGRWLSKTVLTNRSLPSLVILGAAMRLIYFVFELVFSRSSQIFGGSVWYMVSGSDIWRILSAFLIEIVFLAFAFIIYAGFRGERSRMLTHVSRS